MMWPRHFLNACSLLILLLGRTSAGMAKATAAGAGQVLVAGGRSIKVPPPQGFERADGLYPTWDEAVSSSLPGTNRLLGNYALPENVEKLQDEKVPEFASSFNVQVMKKFEGQEIGLTTFAGFRQSIANQMGSAVANLDEAMAQASGKLNDFLEKAGAESQLAIGKPVPLGVFTNTDQVVGFSMLLPMDHGAGRTSTSVVACAMAPVNGRLLFFYNTLPWLSKEDQVKAENNVLAWQRSVSAVNPALAGPSGGWKRLYHGFGLASFLAGLTGGLLCLFLLMRRKAKMARGIDPVVGVTIRLLQPDGLAAQLRHQPGQGRRDEHHD